MSGQIQEVLRDVEVGNSLLAIVDDAYERIRTLLTGDLVITGAAVGNFEGSVSWLQVPQLHIC